MKRLNLGIIGCGRISYKHVQAAIDNLDKIKLNAVCDVIEKNAKSRATQYTDSCGDNLKIHSDYKKMLATEDIDFVAICTESGYHAKIAIDCMNSGKHVLVEKPMALSVSDAEKMIEVAKKNHVKLCVSHQNRFNPPIQRLRKAIEEGRFGRIIAANARILWNRNQSYYSQAPWRGTYELDGGCLMNQCIHDIDLLQWMLGGDVQWVNGAVGNFMHDYIQAEDYGSIQLGMKSGAVGNIEGTVCIYPANLEETLTIIGEKGTVVIGGLAVNTIETWKFSDNIDDEEIIKAECSSEVENVYGNGHSPLYTDFVGAVSENRKPYIDGNDGKIAMQIILAAYKSSKDRVRINWDTDCMDLKSADGGGI